MKLIPPTNNVLVSVKQKYTSNISKIMKMAAIQNNASVDPADVVQIVGVVEGLPNKITTHLRDYEGFSTKDLEVGDTVIFSYKVIYDMLPIESTEPVYRNMMWYRGKEYFSADIRKIFAIIRGEEIIMINGYVMGTEVAESKIILPPSLKRIKQAAQTEILNIGMPKENATPLDVYKGDIVYFNPFVAQKYQINDKKFIIINQSHILGKNLAN